MSTLTFSYIALPHLIFFLGYFNFLLSAIGVGALAVGFWRINSDLNEEVEYVKLNHLIVLAISSLVLAYLSGAGGYYFQSADYEKHFAMLNDLVSKDWPVQYQISDKTYYLVYYFGLYMVPAALGKLLSFQVAQFFFLIWVSLGIFLTSIWILKICKKVAGWIFLLFLFCSGMDVVGWVVQWKVPLWHGFEWWASSSATVSFLQQITWTPQHALAGWILSALCLDAAQRQKPRLVIFVISLSLFWSPFVGVGLLMFVPTILVSKTRGELLDPWLLLSAFSLGAVFLAFFAGRSPEVHQGFANFGIWNFLLSWFLEIGALSGLLAYIFVKQKDRILLSVLAGANAIYLVKFYRYGLFSDLGVQAMIPATFVIFVLALKNVFERNYRKTIVGFLIMGGATSLIELSIILLRRDRQKVVSVSELDPRIAKQYLGSYDLK